MKIHILFELLKYFLEIMLAVNTPDYSNSFENAMIQNRFQIIINIRPLSSIGTD